MCADYIILVQGQVQSITIIIINTILLNYHDHKKFIYMYVLHRTYILCIRIHICMCTVGTIMYVHVMYLYIHRNKHYVHYYVQSAHMYMQQITSCTYVCLCEWCVLK